MLLDGKKLKRVSPNILREDTQGNRALEWRKSFNYLNLNLEEVKIVHSFSVNEKEITLKNNHNSEEKFDFIKPQPKLVRRIEALVSSTKDKIYSIVKGDDDSIYTVEKPKDKIRISIREQEEVKEVKSFPNGVFYGTIFRCVEKHEDIDCIYVECSVPSSQMDELISNVSTDKSILISILVRSFTYEVEDSLGEYWMAKTHLIDESDYAILSSIHIETTGLTPESIKSDVKVDPVVRKVSDYSRLEKSLENLIKVMWVIAAVLIINLFK